MNHYCYQSLVLPTDGCPPVLQSPIGYKPMLDVPAFFADVDNPGRWSEFVFQPKYGAAEKGRSKKYVGHVTPAGAKVVPMNDDGIRKKKVFYRGWKPDEFDATNFCRGMANKECMKPADRKGLLDANRLQQLRLMAERMKCDPLFFLQLLLPFCDPKRSGVDGDGRMPFFTNASIYTNGYAVMEKGWGTGYRHEFKLVTEQELVRWLGVPIRHGARDGSASGLHRRWMHDDVDFDEVIQNNMTYSSWRQIKSIFKLNNNLTTRSCRKV